jgi:hypothetical protein
VLNIGNVDVQINYDIKKLGEFLRAQGLPLEMD